MSLRDGVPRPAAKSLRRDTERAVELARHVLEGDERRKFDERILVEMPPEAGEQRIIDLAVRQRHRLGVVEGDALPLLEQRTVAPGGEGVDLLRRHASPFENEGIEIDAERAVIELRDTDRQQRPERRCEGRSLAVERAIKQGDAE